MGFETNAASAKFAMQLVDRKLQIGALDAQPEVAKPQAQQLLVRQQFPGVRLRSRTAGLRSGTAGLHAGAAEARLGHVEKYREDRSPAPRVASRLPHSKIGASLAITSAMIAAETVSSLWPLRACISTSRG